MIYWWEATYIFNFRWEIAGSDSRIHPCCRWSWHCHNQPPLHQTRATGSGHSRPWINGRSDQQDAGKPSCPAADISACSEEDTRRCISFISHLFSCTRGASTTLRWSIVTRQNGCTTLHHPDIVFEDPSFGCAPPPQEDNERSVVGLLLVWVFVI